MKRREVSRRAICALLALTVLAASCGGESPITLDPLPSTTEPAPEAGSDDESASPATAPSADEQDVEAGQEWIDVTANLTGTESWCGNLAFVSAHPERDQVFAGVAGQGLFVNRPDAPEWDPLGRGDLSTPLGHRTSSIVYDPDDPDRFWESGFYGLGPPPVADAADVNRTDDGGQTFVSLGTPVSADLVSVDFTDPRRRTLLVGAHGLAQVHRSQDGGQTWEDISSGLPGGALGEASFPHVIDAQTYLLGAHKGAAAGIFRSADGGQTWTRVFDLAASGPPLASRDGNLYWVLDAGGVARSTDAGETWELLPSTAPAGGERRGRIVELDDGTWITLGVDFMIVSRDQGETWQSVGPPLPFQPQGFTYSPARQAVYAWQNYCDFEAGTNPVLAESIVRLDLDVEA